MLQGVTGGFRDYKGLQTVKKGYRGLEEALEEAGSVYRGLQEVTEGYEGLPGVSGVTRG